MTRSIARFWQNGACHSNGTACATRVGSQREFRRWLAAEQARADRHQREFSVITFRVLDDSSRERLLASIGDWLEHPDHTVDRAGRQGPNQLAILLPAVGGESAAAAAKAMAGAGDEHAGNIEWNVETYFADAADSSLARSPHDQRQVEPGAPARNTVVSPCPGWKRAMDVTGSLVGLVALSPVLLFVAVWIKCVAHGPVLFRQQRFGLAGRPFIVWKFRTMESSNAEEHHRSHVKGLMSNDRPLVKCDDEMRIIRGGRRIRQLGLDELPQLINVLVGEMSLVGPRPDVVPLDQYQDWQRHRFDVVPGITGLWQVSGKNQTTFSTMMQLDTAYVRQRSLWLDLAILLKTIPAVVSD
jgi:lipopolysaccharide/colanic/teichoic acid biosynthesis glycosyltransferase